MKKWNLLMVFLICTALLAGCGSPASQSADSTGDSPSHQTQETGGELVKIDLMEFVTGPANGGWAQVGAAISDRVNGYFEGFPITATTGGAISNPMVVASGDAQIGLSQGIFLSKAMAAEDPYDQEITNLRGVASLDSTALYFIVDAGVEADSLGELIEQDLKLKLGVMPPSAASSMATNFVLEEYGLSDVSDLQESGSQTYVAEGSALYDAYADRHFNMIIINKAIPDASTKEMLTGRDSKILSLEPEVVEALAEKYDWSPMTIPAGTYPNQEEDILTVGIKSVLIVREDVPDEVAYYLAKVVYEEKEYLETVQAQYKSVDRNEMYKYLTVPMHPGAEAYWKEIGLID